MPKPVGAFIGAADVILSLEYTGPGASGGDPFVSTTAEVGGQSITLDDGTGAYTTSVPADDVIGLTAGAMAHGVSLTRPWGTGQTSVYLRWRADFAGSPSADGFAFLAFFAENFSGFFRLRWDGSSYVVNNGSDDIALPSSAHDGAVHDLIIAVDWAADTLTVFLDGTQVGSAIGAPGGSASVWFAGGNPTAALHTRSVYRFYDGALGAARAAAITASPWEDVGDSAPTEQEATVGSVEAGAQVGGVSAALGAPQAVSVGSAQSGALVGGISAAQSPAQTATVGSAVAAAQAAGGAPPTRSAARVYAWGHSLVDWRYEVGGPVFVERAQVGTGMSEIADELGLAACFSGSYPLETLIPAFAGYESIAAGDWTDGHIHVPSCFGAGGWTAQNFDVGTITDNNFTWEQGVELGANVGQTSAARTLINRIRSVAAPGFDIYLYSHWPPTDETIPPNGGWNAAGFAQWKLWLPGFATYYEALQDATNALLSANSEPATIRLVPTTQVFEALFTGSGPLSDWTFDEVFADGTHGTDSTYFLSGLVHFVAIYGVRPSNTFPVSLAANPTLDSRLETLWSEIVDVAWATIVGDPDLALRVYGQPVGGLSAALGDEQEATVGSAQALAQVGGVSASQAVIQTATIGSAEAGAQAGGASATLGTPQAVGVGSVEAGVVVGGVSASQAVIQAVSVGSVEATAQSGGVSAALGSPQAVGVASVEAGAQVGGVFAVLSGVAVTVGSAQAGAQVGGVSVALGSPQAVAVGSAVASAQVGGVEAGAPPSPTTEVLQGSRGSLVNRAHILDEVRWRASEIRVARGYPVDVRIVTPDLRTFETARLDRLPDGPGVGAVVCVFAASSAQPPPQYYLGWEDQTVRIDVVAHVAGEDHAERIRLIAELERSIRDELDLDPTRGGWAIHTRYATGVDTDEGTPERTGGHTDGTVSAICAIECLYQPGLADERGRPMRYASIYLGTPRVLPTTPTYVEIGGPWEVGIVAPAALAVDAATGRITYRQQRALDFACDLVATVSSSVPTTARLRLRIGATPVARTEIEVPVGTAAQQITLTDLVRLGPGDELRLEVQTVDAAILTFSRASLRLSPAALI